MMIKDVTKTHTCLLIKWLYPNLGLGKINEISQACICFHSLDRLFKVMPLGETNAISFHTHKKVSLKHE